MPGARSTAVADIGHDPESRTLRIGYKGGVLCRHSGVPPEAYRDLLEAESIGVFVNLHIKPDYPYALESGRRRFRPD